MKKWLNPTPLTVPDDLHQAIGGHPIVAERLVRRGITTPDAAKRFLSPANYTPAPPNELPDIDRAVKRVQTAIRDGERILVWGDFDVDGQTGTALLVSALRDIGAKVDFYIPNRFTEGHGIPVSALETRLDGVNLLLTCDTGITAHDAVKTATRRGVDTVITDHHTLAETLPDAYAVVNPMRLPDGHPMRELSGVGVAYQLVRALYGDKSSDHLLDLVAVGLVADVMVLVDDTRYWLQRGLEILRNNPRPGIRAMLERAEIDPADLTESDIGFALAPRLNALGRLGDANPAVELLTTSDPAVIVERVNELEGLNHKRRFLTRQIYEAAQQKIAQDESLLKYAALVVSGEGWHTGVLGIVASRLVEDYGCPVVVLSENDGIASGSARSVAGCNIVEAFNEHAHLLKSYGGHNMAAGLSLASADIYPFRRGLSVSVRKQLGSAQVEPEIAIDAEIALSAVDLDFAYDIARLAPFGNGNPPLTLVSRSLHITSRRTLGNRGDHLSLRVEDESGQSRRVLWWFGDVNAIPDGKFDLAYTVRVGVFNGAQTAMIEWLDAHPVDDADAIRSKQPTYQFVDYRQHPDPRAALAEIQRDYPDVLVWREQAGKGVDGVDRYHLRGAETLVVWSAPPDPLVWNAALQTVQPQTIVLFGNQPPFNDAQSLLKHLTGLIKYAANYKGGQVSVSELAGLTGQREQTIRLALKWLHANTDIAVTALSDEPDIMRVRIDPDHAKFPPFNDNDILKRLIAETNAYRQYWLHQA